MSVLRVARHELRLAWRSRAVAVFAGALSLLLLGSAVAGLARQRREGEQRRRYQDLVERQFQEQPDRHPHRVSHYGFLVFRPPAPLAFFDNGVLGFTGVSLFLEAHRQNTANFSEAGQSEGASRFGELTAASVLQLFVPLFVFLVAGVSVTREREAGTLGLLLCQGASPRSILCGKLIAALSLVAAVVIPGLVLILPPLAGSLTWSAERLVRAAALAAALGLYFVGCAAIALLVSRGHRSSRGALASLVGFWMAGWVLLPRVLPPVASALHPLPSRSAFEAQVEGTLRRLGDSHNPNDPAFRALRTATLARYGAERVEDLPVNYNGIVMNEGERLTAEAYRRHVDELHDACSRQARVVEAAALLSPFVAIRTASMALAGSDLPHSLEFERKAEAFRYRLVQELNELHTTAVPYARDRYEGGAEGGAPSRMRIDRAHWNRLPSFAAPEPSPAWALARHPVALLALLAWTVVPATLLARQARRLAP